MAPFLSGHGVLTKRARYTDGSDEAACKYWINRSQNCRTVSCCQLMQIKLLYYVSLALLQVLSCYYTQQEICCMERESAQSHAFQSVNSLNRLHIDVQIHNI